MSKLIPGQIDLFDMLARTDSGMDFSNIKTVRLREVARIERAIEKEYQTGTIFVALSATKGQIEFLESPTKGSSRWAAVTVTSDDLPEYMYYAMQRGWLRFLHQAKTGINLQIDALSEFCFEMHLDKKAQRFIVSAMRLAEKAQQQEELEIAALKSIKKYYMNGMFC